MFNKAFVATLLVPAFLATGAYAKDTYEFESRFDGQSSVGYDGQAFRQVLINDMKSYMSSLKSGAYEGTIEEAYLSLDSYYSYFWDNQNQNPGVIYGYAQFGVTARDLNGYRMDTKGLYYADLQDPGKQLRNKTAGNDNPLRRLGLKGWNLNKFYGQDLKAMESDKAGDGFVEPEDLVDAWMRVMANNLVDGESFTISNGDQPAQTYNNANLTPNGWDLAQLTQKLLHGAVSYSQAARDYMSTDLGSSKGLNADNEKQYKGSRNYTALEHHWDEGFGYFGAARDYLRYSKSQIKSGRSIDTNGDGQIDLLSEKNQGVSRNSAKRDLDSIVDNDLTGRVMKAFIAGRQLIQDKPEGYREQLKVQSQIALDAWEKTIAATVIHYINDTVKDMDAYGTSAYSFSTHAKHWGEMKGYALAFQFSPISSVDDQTFDLVHTLMADQPVLGSAGSAAMAQYRKDLLQARELLKDAFNFNAENVRNW